MALSRPSGLYGFGQLRNELDRHFSTLVENLPSVNGRTFPAVNVWEEGDDLYAEAEVPGLSSEELSISVVGRELTISGERKERSEETTYHRRERGTGAFTRIIRLPFDVDSSKVQASLRDGVLQVTLPKSEAAKPRKIQVNTAPSA